MAPSTAAARELPIGEADGVRVRADRGAVAVVFTPRAARLYRKIANRKITIACTDLPARINLGGTATRSAGESFRAPPRRRTLRTISMAARDFDYCRVWLERKPRELVVSVPLTQAGAVHLDEQVRAGDLRTLLELAGLLADERRSVNWPTPGELFGAEFGGRPLRDVCPRPLVALDSPAGTPPVDAIGYYSDGSAHVAAVILSAAGRRLFIEFDADEAVHTNVAGYIYDGVGD